MPERIQLRRTKGWRKPEGAVVVARPSKWGNPFKVGSKHPFYSHPRTGPRAVIDYAHLVSPSDPEFVAEFAAGMSVSEVVERRAWVHEHIHELRGKDLACWCPLDQPCHADVLLELANKDSAS